ncbi:hypothetical protein, partial [uncultured Varibaculum sp.]|uniref:hypothetical protein n=1 Tax=uncultured Varibaculum sp. TaxID=413896 RepID=UPI002675EB7B
PIQKHPPRTVPPSKSPTQPTIPDRSTRLIQNHPPNPGKTDEKQALPVNPEGDSVAGGRFYPRKVVLLWEGGFTQTGKAIPSSEGDNVRQTDATRKNARQHHPPQTKTPSQNRSALPIQDTSNHSALPRHQHPPKTKKGSSWKAAESLKKGQKSSKNGFDPRDSLGSKPSKTIKNLSALLS